MMKVDYVVDASGQNCPMPLLKAKQKLNKMQEGECLKLIATDKGSVRDIPAFVNITNHKLVDPNDLYDEEPIELGTYVYYIVKGLN